jgi:hypothetical protein
MQFDKSMLIDQLKTLGRHEDAQRADKELPNTVDSEKHSDLLSRFGIDPSMLSQLGNPSELLDKAKGIFGR